jgi:hypothetical protein
MLGPEDSWAKRSEGIRRVGRGCPRFCFGGWNLRKRERERERAKLEQRATTNKGDGQPNLEATLRSPTREWLCDREKYKSYLSSISWFRACGCWPDGSKLLVTLQASLLADEELGGFG